MQSAESVERETITIPKSLKAQLQKTIVETTCHSCSPRKVIGTEQFYYEFTNGQKTVKVNFCNELELNEWKERCELKNLPTPVETQHQQ